MHYWRERRAQTAQAQAQRAARAPAVRLPRRQGLPPGQKQAWTFQLEAVQRNAQALEGYHRKGKTAAGESPFLVLRDHVLPEGTSLLAYEAAPPPPPREPGLLGWLRNPEIPSGHWCSAIDHQVRFRGTPTSCESLSSWGRATRSVVEPALGAVRVRGRAPRGARPQSSAA